MKMVYWYTPFADLAGDVTHTVDGGNKHQGNNIATIEAHKTKRYIECTRRAPPLRGLGVADRLYIIGHGDVNAGLLVADAAAPSPPGYSSWGGKPALSPAELVAKMTADGCEWKVTDIRIYSCKAARGPTSFVKKFADLVHALNEDIVVYGYTGLLDRTTPPGAKLAKFDTGPHPMKKASEFRVAFRKTVEIPEDGDDWATPDFGTLVWKSGS